MSDSQEALGRRLFASVRHERPSAELRNKVLALGRAERARVQSGLVQRASLPARPTARRLLRRGVGWSLGVVAVAALALLIVRATSDRSEIIMSPERSGAPVAGLDRRRAPAGEAGASPPPEATPERRPAILSRGPARTKRAVQTNAPQASPASKADAGPASREGRSTLAQQLEQVKIVRAALRAGDPARALALLDAYQVRSGGGELDAEASLLRIEALAASGRRGEAAELARKFAVAHPNSPLIDRVLNYAEE